MNKNRTKNNQKGFSLIELAILSVVVGLILSNVIQSYNRYSFKREAEDSIARINEIKSSIGVFLAQAKRYPCPAAAAVPQGTNLDGTSTNYGQEACGFAYALARNTCAQGICRVDGNRDTGGALSTEVIGSPGNTITLTTSGPNFDPEDDTVLIGVVPFKALNLSTNLSTQDFFDGYGNQFTYAVTETSTRRAGHVDGGYNRDTGTIEVILESGNIDISDEVAGLIAIVISHGPDGVGAYSTAGIRSGCASVPAHLDLENCDDDSTFRDISDRINTLSRKKDDPSYYDDTMAKNFETGSATWTRSTLDPTDIYNPSGFNIGIGTDIPRTNVDVDGIVKSDLDVRAVQYCNYAPDPLDPTRIIATNCFDPDIIAGSGIQCPANQAMVGIANNQANCEPVALTGVAPNQACPPGQFIYELQGANIRCRAP